MVRAKSSSILGLELGCDKIVSDIHGIIKGMSEYKINDQTPGVRSDDHDLILQSGSDDQDLILQSARHAIVHENWEQALQHVNRIRGRACLNGDAHLLVAMVYAREDFRKAQYDIAISHLEEILRNKPEEKRVEKFWHVVKRALKLQEKLKEKERCIHIEGKDVMKETRKSNWPCC